MDESFDQVKREIAWEYERRNSKLSEYMKTMECIYEKQKAESHKKQSLLEGEIKELRKKLEFALSLGKSKNVEPDGRRVKFNNAMVEELEAKVKDLSGELQKKEELVGYRRKRDDWGRMKLEAEVKALRKKATVGWMLGSLWEVSLQGDELGETSSLAKMLRKLQKDLERENFSATGGSNDVLDRDVQALLEQVETTLQKSKVSSRAEPSRKDESSQANGPGSSRVIPRGMLSSPRSPRSPASPRSPNASPVFKLQQHRETTSPVKTGQAGQEEAANTADGGGVVGGTTIGIRQMLSSIDANIRMLLENERRRTPCGTEKPGSPQTNRAMWKRW